MGQVYLEIESLDTLVAFLTDAKKKGFLKNVSIEMVESLFKTKTFPIRVPVDIYAILEAADNKILKAKYGKRIEEKTVENLNMALRLS